MKIVIDCRLYSQTGVGRYIRAILAYLQANSSNLKDKYVLIVLSSEVGLFSDYPANIKIIKSSAKWHSLKEQFAIPRLLFKEKPDLVHFPYFNVPVFYFGKFIVTIHDLTINKFKTGKATRLPHLFYFVKKFFYHLVIFLAIKKAVKILTVSETVKQEIVKKYGVEDEKVRVIYNGSELEGASRMGNQGDRGDRGEYILYVGNLHPHKNVETLILAFDDLIKIERFRDLKLVIVSGFDFFYTKLFEFILKLKLENKIKFSGQIPNSKLINFYKNARVLVFPSFAEGFGIPGVEAMRLGCPVVVSKIPVFEEVYGEAALYFLPKNAVDLKEKLVCILNDNNLREKYIQLGTERAKLFTWDKMAKQILEIYENSIRV